MTITVAAEQLTRAQRSSVISVPLVVLETFTDRDAQTVGATRYWTRTGRAVRYKWDGSTDQMFEPLLQLVSPISRGFNHLPDAQSYDTREAVELSIDGSSRSGFYLWKTLLAENIIGARVTIASLLIESDHVGVDLGFSSADHVVRWRGEVTQLSEIEGDGSTFSLLVESKDSKLGSAVLAVGQSGAEIPVLYDETVKVELYPVSLGYRGEIKGGSYSATSKEYLGVLWDNNDVPLGSSNPLKIDDSEIYPAVWTIPHGDDDGDDDEIPFTIWGGHISDPSTTGSRFFRYERVDDPGEDGAPQVDLSYTLGANVAPTFAIANYTVFVPKFILRWAICGGYVRNITNFRSVNDGSTYLVPYWNIWTDTTDPLNVVTYMELIDDKAPISEAFIGDALQAKNAGNVPQFAVSVLEMWGLPTGAFTTVVDGSSYTLADITSAAGWIISSTTTGTGTNTPGFAAHADLFDPGFPTNMPSASYRHGDESEAAVLRVSDDILVYQSTARLGLFAEFDFDTDDDMYGDQEIEAVLKFETFTRVTRVYLTIWGTYQYSYRNWRKPKAFDQDPRDYEQRQSDAMVCKRRVELEYDGLGTGTYRIKQAIAQATGNYVEKIRITVHFNQNAAANAFYVTEIRHRPLTLVNQQNHPLDMVETIVSDYLPDSSLTVDASSFATAKANVPGVEVTPELSRYPNLGELLSAVSFAGRTNFVYSETTSGTVLKAFAAEADYDFPAATRDIGAEFVDLKVNVRAMTEIATRFNWLYDLPPAGDVYSSGEYARAVRATRFENPYSADVATSDFTAAEAAFGARESITIPIEMIRDEASLLEVTGYYVNESLRGQVERYTCVVPYWIGYDLEPGDIVSIRPAWESADVKVRVCRTVFNFDANGIGLVLESVT